MKAARFAYRRPESLEEALDLLAGAGGEARPIAGGQSLAPMMAMRLARPALLVDIARIAALAGIERRGGGPEGGGTVAIRAATRQVDAERSAAVAAGAPLLAAALPWVGHIQTRNRGTVGGSVAHADPTAEIVLAAVALGAEVELASVRGRRTLAAAGFALAPMETAAGEDELLTEIRFPAPPAGLAVGAAVEEVAPRAGDYALVAAAAEVGLDGEGRCRHLRLAASGASPVPVRAAPVEAALDGSRLDDGAVEAAARAIGPLLDPESDIQATAAYRRRVAPGLLARAIRAARDRALAAGGRAAA